MKLIIQMGLGNADFEDNGTEAVRAVLSDIPDRLPEPLALTRGKLMILDANGANIGTAEIVEEETEALPVNHPAKRPEGKVGEVLKMLDDQCDAPSWAIIGLIYREIAEGNGYLDHLRAQMKELAEQAQLCWQMLQAD